LETALGAKLFDRLPTGYMLTPAGERLTIEAEEMERVAIRISSELSEDASRMTGSIRVGTPEGFGNYFLSKHLRIFCDRYPGVSLEWIANPAVVSLTKRQADIAVMMSRPESGPLKTQKLGDYEYGLYGSQSLLSTLAPISSLDHARACRLIGYIPDLLPTPQHDYLREIFNGRKADLQVSNILTQTNATLEGHGLCLLPCFMAASHPELIRILADEIAFVRSYWLVTHSAMRAPARVRAMRDFLLERVETHRTLFLPSGRPPNARRLDRG